MTGNPDVAASWVSGGDPVLKTTACHHSGRNVNTALSLPRRRSPSLFTFLAIPQVTQGQTRDAGFPAGHARHVLAAPEGLKQRPFGLILHFFARRLPSYSRGNVTGELENVCAESADGDSCCQPVRRDWLFTMPDGCSGRRRLKGVRAWVCLCVRVCVCMCVSLLLCFVSGV